MQEGEFQFLDRPECEGCAGWTSPPRLWKEVCGLRSRSWGQGGGSLQHRKRFAPDFVCSAPPSCSAVADSGAGPPPRRVEGDGQSHSKLPVSKLPGAAGFLHTEQKQQEQVTHQATRQMAGCPWKRGTEQANTVSQTGGNAWAPGMSASCWGLSEEVTYNVCMLTKMTHFSGGGGFNCFIPSFNKLAVYCKVSRI